MPIDPDFYTAPAYTVCLVPEVENGVVTGDLIAASAVVDVATGSLITAEATSSITTGALLSVKAKAGLTTLGVC